MLHSSAKKRTTWLGTFATIVAYSLALPTVAHAQTSAWSGVCVSTTDPDVATIQGFQCLIANVFSVALTLIGLAGFVMLVIGSMRWMMSGGNAQTVEKSKNTISFAVLGLIVGLSAFIILNLVAEFTGVQTLLQFTIPDSSTVW